jgi:hypothetical protein
MYRSSKTGPRQSGQVMIEYVLVTTVVALALLMPQALTNNMPVGEYLANVLRAFFRAYSLIVSLF